ncbi:MAG: DUF4886 domain-containing protein [Lentisphaeria bacterium]|jgi:hypothetical protein|nr:DUF4886 domain-containing protein [Lentisphaeria bacterium]
MRTIRLLTIGNSFSENALTYLERIAQSEGQVNFLVGRASLGGCSLEKHWNIATYTEAHPEYKTYSLGKLSAGEPVQANLQEALVAEKWDMVTLQQVSWKSWRPETFEPWLGRLVELVGRLAPQAEILLHQTWAYRLDSPFFCEQGLSQQLMHERIAAAYAHYAAKYGCRILPSGEAVHRARSVPGRQFRWPEETYAYRSASAPALPAQENSFASGWNWAIRETPEGIPELRLDANHLNARGNYLAGCVWYEAMTGLPTSGRTFVPDGIETEDAAFLRQIAHATVAG